MTKMPLNVHFCYKIKLILNPQVKTPDHNVPICSVKSHYVKQGLIRDKRKKRDGAGLVMLHVRLFCIARFRVTTVSSSTILIVPGPPRRGLAWIM